MWWVYYALLTIVVLFIGFVVYVFKKGYAKVSPAPLKGILLIGREHCNFLIRKMFIWLHHIESSNFWSELNITFLTDIPCPPLTHSMLGHPDKMLHPLKHEFRLEVCESTKAAFHQVNHLFHLKLYLCTLSAHTFQLIVKSFSQPCSVHSYWWWSTLLSSSMTLQKLVDWSRRCPRKVLSMQLSDTMQMSQTC